MKQPTFQTEIDALAAPGRDGDCLFHPAPSSFADLARQNRDRLAASPLRILDRSLQSLREPWIVGGPIIMSGHQPEWMHPGVWAKNVAAVTLARRMAGRAVLLVVDSDVPDRLAIQFPDESDGRLRRVTAGAGIHHKGRAFEHLPIVSSAEWRSLFTSISTGADSALPIFTDAFVNTEEVSGSESVDYVSRWLNAVRALDLALGGESPEPWRISDIFSCRSPDKGAAAMAFTAAVVLSAREFAGDYNGALQSYRDRRAIRGNRHPIPDLELENGRVELPFWIVHPDHPRRRLFVEMDHSIVRFFAETEHIGTCKTEPLRSNSWQVLPEVLAPFCIRPRALAQTMFTRLFCCDLFIHGIGGAKYDQITDDIVRRFFKLDPPAYACVSATLRLPLNVHGVTRRDLHAAARRARDLRYNPQRYLDVENTGRELSDLVAARQSAIEESIRLRSVSKDNRPARRNAFEKIRQANLAMLQSRPDLEKTALQAGRSLIQQFEHDLIADWREWFYALQPLSRLRALSQSINASLK